jgi:hypothetical protein
VVQDTDALYDKLKDENNRSRLLKQLLFEESPIYGGRALFEKFDEDVQDQIKIFLGRLVSILHEGYELLYRRYGTSGTIIRSPSPQNSISSQKSSSTLDLLKTFPKSSMMVLRWSLRDKKVPKLFLFTYLESSALCSQKMQEKPMLIRWAEN